MRFFNTLSIDLGTANTIIYDVHQETFFREPSVIALDTETDDIVSIGTEASELRGRTADSVKVERPLKDGVIVALDAADVMLEYFVRQSVGRGTLLTPRVIVGIPSGATDIERRALQEAVHKSGARLRYFIDEPVAAAIGAGLPVTDPIGSMIVDIGGGTSEVAVVSLGGIVHSESIDVAGDELTSVIRNYVKQQYHLMIGEQTAEKIKHELGSAIAIKELDEHKLEVSGTNLVSGLPAKIKIKGAEIREILAEPVSMIVAIIKQALERVPPEVAADLTREGITLAGGGALLKGLDRLISQEFDLKVRIPDDPLSCVVVGAGMAIADTDKYQRLLQPLD